MVVHPREPEVTSILTALDDGMNRIHHVCDVTPPRA
jgi:hypothetical protein